MQLEARVGGRIVRLCRSTRWNETRLADSVGVLYANALHFTGPKTVFFWAPAMKWCLVAAGLNDLTRPAEKLSVSQNIGTFKAVPACCKPTDLRTMCLPHRGCPSLRSALTATGFIWVRYSFVIIPVNVSLAAVRLAELHDLVGIFNVYI